MVGALDRTLSAAAARVSFLECRDPPGVELPDLLMQSWQRSRSAGVDPSAARSVHDTNTDADSLLVRCAAPVLHELEADAEDLPLVIVLIDAEARVVQRLGGSRQLTRLLDRVDLAPGFDYAESTMGTNGIGTAFAAGQLVSVVGPEHYSENLHLFGCAGAPILDPATGRLAGVVDITTMSDMWNPLFKTVVKKAAKDIGRNLMLDYSHAERAVLDAYLATVARSAGKAVLAFGEMVSLTNLAAQRLFDADEQRTLREYAVALIAGRERATDTWATSGGQRLIDIEASSVSAGSKTVGTVIVGEPVADRRPPVRNGSKVDGSSIVAGPGAAGASWSGTAPSLSRANRWSGDGM